MEILNNRELAIVFWLIAISIYIFSSKKMKDVRKSFRNLVSAFFVRQIISVLLLMVIYMGVIVYALSEVELWNIEQVKNTIFWCASVGFMSLFKLESIKKDREFFKHSVINNLKLLAIIQFIVGVYAFPLLVEVILVPFLATIGAMAAIADSDKKYAQVKSLLEYLLFCFGLLVIAYTVYMLATNFGGIAKEKTLYDFIVPALLTILYLPFIFVLMVYSTYEQVSVRLRFSIKNNMLRYVAMVYAILVFNVRIYLLERWSGHVARENIDSHSDLINSFKHIFRVRKAEKNPVDVPCEDGWSPYKAKYFLSKEGLEAGNYNKSFEEWYASSPMMEFGEGIIPDNIAFYIEGTEKIANTLKIKLNINDSSRSNVSQKKLLDVSNVLCHASLNRGLSDVIKNAILNAKPYTEAHGNKKVSLQKEIWRKHAYGGYDVKFIVSSI